LALLKAHTARGNDRAKKLFQLLNEIAARALRMHLGRVLELAESSPDKWTYERKVVERFGGYVLRFRSSQTTPTAAQQGAVQFALHRRANDEAASVGGVIADGFPD
jgi:glutathione peroxidase-family protein